MLMIPRRSVLQLTTEELAAEVDKAGGKPFQAAAIRRWILDRAADDFTKMTDLAKPVAARLAKSIVPLANEVVSRRTSPDGTVKLLLKLEDANTVETVWMPGASAATVCVSTQVGCPMACQFCASGLAGVVRNLQFHEIVEQLVRARGIAPFGRIVVMGIGEPLLNLENVLSALEIATNADGMGISARKITISTVGFPAKIREIAKLNKPFTLAVSLHAPNDALRRQLIPTATKVTIADLLGASNDYFKQTGREVTFEYVLLHHVNDRAEHARELARVLRGARGSVNLIPYNPIPGSPFMRPPEESVRAFRETLRRAGVVATVRWSKGIEADAACGQLRIHSQAAPT
ncbi:MAG: 23S rRNA (adenine(2503)-C(2))-methyltransferase RlmN [Planctomycetota bacterium]